MRSRWAASCSAPPSASTSRSAWTSAARSSTPLARWSPTRRTCPCTWAPCPRPSGSRRARAPGACAALCLPVRATAERAAHRRGLRRLRPGVQTHFWGPEGEGAAEGLRPGDVLASNHPQLAGGSHLPDITVITPVFNEGRIECAPAAAPPRIRDQPACRRAGAAPQVLCGVARPPRGRGRHHARVHAPQQPPAGRGGRRHHRVQACARGALPGGPLPPVPRARFWPACASCTRQRHCHAWRGPHGRQAKAAWRL